MSADIKTSTNVSEYDFDLPKELIAQHPLANREDARLMLIDRKSDSISHGHFRDLPDYLNDGDCLVLNETRVIPAKLVGFRDKTKGRWDGLYLEHDADSQVIRMLCKTRGKLQPGELVTLQDRDGIDRVQIRMVTRIGGGCWAAICEGETTVDELIEMVGRIPLPHYIRRGNMTDADVNDYQTVYARNPGSVAAPTAGLHFTERLLKKVAERGVRICRVTLQVGTGTFKPISTDIVEQHEMHSERGEISQATAGVINETRSSGGRVIAVGTTSVRVLETVGASSPMRAWSGETDLYIRPSHQFQVVDGMITNFHLPRTTLLVMVRAMGGDALVRRAYAEAIKNRYRFFSYGDAMLIV
jgi:S-adenosylmethionine:tRNA ribosyltransferase-isomerase